MYKTSLAVLEKGGIPLVLGGDHSLAAGSVAATADFVRREEKPLGLIWVDAHGDMNTPATSGSGNVHGMPLAALLGAEPAELSRIGGFSPKVTPDRTVLIGIRNLDDREKEPHPRIRRPRLHDEGHRSQRHRADRRTRDCARRRRHGRPARLVRHGRLRSDDRARASARPVKGGLDYREAHMVMEMVADSGLLRALDLVEVNPILDDRNMTAILGAELASSALGQKII